MVRYRIHKSILRTPILGNTKELVPVRGLVKCFVRCAFLWWRVVCHQAQNHSWRTTHCWRSVTAYSMYSQPPSRSGGRSFHPQPEDASCRSNRNPTVNNRAVNKAHPWSDDFSPHLTIHTESFIAPTNAQHIYIKTLNFFYFKICNNCSYVFRFRLKRSSGNS